MVVLGAGESEFVARGVTAAGHGGWEWGDLSQDGGRISRPPSTAPKETNMKRPWRVVHNSSHKRVLIRPRNRPRPIPHPKPAPIVPVAPPADDWSWVFDILRGLAPVFLVILALCIIIAYWEIILGCLLVFGILRYCAR
jgi:hypothetical protein